MELTLYYLGLALLGLGAGCYGVIIGAGGGFIIAPLLILVWGLPPHLAVGTTLAVVWLNSLSGARAYLRQGRVDWRSGLLMGLVAIPGSVLGAVGVKIVPSGAFQAVLGSLLLAMAVYTLATIARGGALTAAAGSEPSQQNAQSFPGKPEDSGEGLPRRWGRAYRTIELDSGEVYRYSFALPPVMGVNFLLGFLSSFIGIGGGFLRTPLLVYAFGFPVMVATATSIFAMTILTTVGTLSHALLGNISYPVSAAVALGAVAGGQLGASLSRRLSGAWVMSMLALVFLFLGLQLLFKFI